MKPQRQPTSQFDTKDSFTFTLKKFQRLDNVHNTPNSRYICCNNCHIFVVFLSLHLCSKNEIECPYPPKFHIKSDFSTFVRLH